MSPGELYRLATRLIEKADSGNGDGYDDACEVLSISLAREKKRSTLASLALCQERRGDRDCTLGKHEEGLKRYEESLKSCDEYLTLVPGADDRLQAKSDVLAGRARVEKKQRSAKEKVANGIPRTTNLGVADKPLVENSKEAKLLDNLNGDDASSGWRTAGVVTAGIGVIALGVGTYYGITALRLRDESAPGCPDNACTPDAKQTRWNAITSGDRSTAAFIVGGALLSAGLTCHLWFCKSSSKRRTTLLPLPSAIGVGGLVVVHRSLP